MPSVGGAAATFVVAAIDGGTRLEVSMEALVSSAYPLAAPEVGVPMARSLLAVTPPITSTAHARGRPATCRSEAVSRLVLTAVGRADGGGSAGLII